MALTGNPKGKPAMTRVSQEKTRICWDSFLPRLCANDADPEVERTSLKEGRKGNILSPYVLSVSPKCLLLCCFWPTKGWSVGRGRRGTLRNLKVAVCQNFPFVVDCLEKRTNKGAIKKRVYKSAP